MHITANLLILYVIIVYKYISLQIIRVSNIDNSIRIIYTLVYILL